MFKVVIFVSMVVASVLSAPTPGVLVGAPSFPLAVSSQVVARNYNAAFYVPQPVAPLVAAPAFAAPAIAAPAFAAPAIAAPAFAAPAIAAPAFSAPAIAAPAFAHPGLAAPLSAYPYYF